MSLGGLTTQMVTSIYVFAGESSASRLSGPVRSPQSVPAGCRSPRRGGCSARRYSLPDSEFGHSTRPSARLRRPPRPSHQLPARRDFRADRRCSRHQAQQV